MSIIKIDPTLIPVVVPESVTPAQARLALLATGRLADAEAVIAGLPSPQQEQARIAWDYSLTIKRTHPLVEALGAALGMSAADLDALFIAAARIDP